MVPGIKSTFDLNDVFAWLALFKGHVRMMLLTFALCLTGGLFYLSFGKAIYYSKAEINHMSLPLPLDTEVLFGDSNWFTVVQRLQSEHMVVKTMFKLGVADTYKGIMGKHIRRLKIGFNSNGNINVEVWAMKPRIVEKFAQTLVEVFVEHREEKRKEYLEAIIDSFTDEMEEIKNQLDQVTGRKVTFSDEKAVTETLIEVSELEQVPKDLVMLNYQLSQMDQLRRALDVENLSPAEQLSLITLFDNDQQIAIQTGILGNSPPPGDDGTGESAGPNIVVIPPSAAGENAWASIERQEVRLLDEIAKKKGTFGAQHPVMVDLNKRLASIQNQITSEAEYARRRLELKYKNLMSRKESLMARLPKYEELQLRREELTYEYQHQDVSHKSWMTMYNMLYKRITDMTFGIDNERVELTYAGLTELRSTIPVSPNRLKLMLMSMGMGLALGIGIPILIEFLDHTFSDLEQVETSFDLPGLGVIPQLDTVDNKTQINGNGANGVHNSIKAEEMRETYLTETVRIIRTNLILRNEMNDGCKVLLVTSSMSGEGKTFVCEKLASSFAQMGKKTLLIDADLRKASLTRGLRLQSQVGLIDYLKGHSNLDETMHTLPDTGLDVVASGGHTRNASDLVSRPNLSEALNELREQYDWIIMDTPPVLGLPETPMYLPMVDGVLFVIWGGHTSTRYIRTSIESLKKNRANVFGVVMNRLDLTSPSNYYRYYYYSRGYYDNYRRPKTQVKATPPELT